jgi:hypothetical protein
VKVGRIHPKFQIVDRTIVTSGLMRGWQAQVKNGDITISNYYYNFELYLRMMEHSAEGSLH